MQTNGVDQAQCWDAGACTLLPLPLLLSLLLVQTHFFDAQAEPALDVTQHGVGSGCSVAAAAAAAAAAAICAICCSQAEPALNVLGETVQTLSGGKFTKKMLIWAVCVGVAIGMCAGGNH
jgi:hypothetical protein